MANLNSDLITRAGVALTYVAAAGGGDTFTPSDTTFLHVYNGGGGSVTVTVVTPQTIYGDIPVDDYTTSISAGTNKLFGPFPAPQFADPTDGLADLSYSGVTSVTVGVFRLKLP